MRRDQHPAELPAPAEPQATKTSAPPIPIRGVPPSTEFVKIDERIDERRHDPPPRRRRRRRPAPRASPATRMRKPAMRNVVADDLVPEMDGVAGVDVPIELALRMDAVALRVDDRAERERVAQARPGGPTRTSTALASPTTAYGVARSIQSATRVRASLTSPRNSKRTPTWCPSATARTKAAEQAVDPARDRGLSRRRRCYSRCGTPPVDSPAAWISTSTGGRSSSGASASGVGGPRSDAGRGRRCGLAKRAVEPRRREGAGADRRPRSGRDQARREPRRRAREGRSDPGSTSAATSCRSSGSSARPESRRSTTTFR